MNEADTVASRDELILRAIFWPRVIMGIGSVVFLSIGSAIWLATGEFSGFSFFSITISGILLVSIIRSIGLRLVVTPRSISQRGWLTSWEVKSHELRSWQLVDTHSTEGYPTIVVRSENGGKRLSDWIVSGNRRQGQVLDRLRRYYGSKETVG